MTLSGRFAPLAFLALPLAWTGCSRSTLDAVTRMPATGGSTSDSRDMAIDPPASGPEASRDVPLEPGPEPGPEPRPEPGPEAGPEAGPEPGPEAGPEAGPDTQPDTATCPSSVLAPGDTNQSVQVAGDRRTYLLHVPSTYKGIKPVPLVVDFHGIGVSGSMERSLSPYPALTDKDGAIMAFPDGLKGPLGPAWNVGPCCVTDFPDDVAFAKALVEQVRGMACIDQYRVYATGYSMGGGMAHYLACHAADVFAAVAPAGFDLLEEQLPDCQPARPITVISFRGTNDNLVPYGGGPSNLVQGMSVNFLGAKKTFQTWAQLDECTDSASAEDPNTGCSSYTNCQGGVEVILCTKANGGNEQGNASVAWPIIKLHNRVP